MCDLPNDIEVELVSVFQIPSNQNARTDTLEEIVYFLDLTIDDQGPVAVTGAQRSPAILGTDTYINLCQSIMLAASPDCENLGTIALFNNKIFPARYVGKHHASLASDNCNIEGEL